ncbi:MAG: DUF819 family protein, partial [Planctomycetales bacterium]|nr:DUF819 family protein [Planctomycetales bacterium]
MPSLPSLLADSLMADEAGVLAVLAGVCALFFWLEKRTQWRLFHYLPPLAFIYLTPVLLSNVKWYGESTALPVQSPVYDALDRLGLPMLLTWLLLNVDVRSALQLMGRGVGVMLCGALGVVVGAPFGYW